jgi:hypothetical protein
MTITRNDILENLNESVEFVVQKAYEAICDPEVWNTLTREERDDVPRRIVWELLCVAHNRATKDEIREILESGLCD